MIWNHLTPAGHPKDNVLCLIRLRGKKLNYCLARYNKDEECFYERTTRLVMNNSLVEAWIPLPE